MRLPEAQAGLEGEFEEILARGLEIDTEFLTLQHHSGATTVIVVILPRARSEGWKLLSLAQCGAV